ncbi:MAG: hypothetical protein ACYCQI_02690 [Gammaproteobacteria bacterium]
MFKSALNKIRLLAKPKKRVTILSYGCSGSYWLGSSLHKLENTFCSTGTDHPLTGIRYWYNKHEFDALVELIKQKIPEINQHGFSQYKVLYNLEPLSTYYYLRNEVGLDISLRVDNHHQIILDELEAVAHHLRPNATHLISVHGQNAQTYLESKYAKQNDVKVFDVIRHPIPRSETWMNIFKWGWENCEETRKQLEKRRMGNLEKFKEYAKHGVDFDDPDNFITFFVYQHNYAFAQSLTLLNCKRITFEDLKEKPETFAQLYYDIYEEKPSKDYIDFVYSPENLSSGRSVHKKSDKPPLSPKEQFDAWTPFQRALFTDLIKNEKLAEVYSPYDYDFSFIR